MQRPCPVRARCRGSNGQALPLVLLVIVLVAATALVIGRIGDLVVSHAQARTAADAAALAGARDGEAAAATAAAANRGTLVSFVTSGDDVEVQVSVGDARATARARRIPIPITCCENSGNVP